MTVLEIRLSDEDRKRYEADEWISLDVDRVLDTPAGMLKRWEQETNYPIERAIDQVGGGLPAVATQILVWLARKQDGSGNDPATGRPETFGRLDDLKTMRVQLRRAVEAEADADAVPPAESEQAEDTPQS